MNLIRKTYQAVETKTADDADRTLVVKISTSNPDRSNDVVAPDGVQLDNYLKNPVVAAFHRYDQPPIGKTVDIQKVDDGVVAKVEFTPKGVNALADQLFEMYKAGFMNAWSIGFIPKKWSDRDNLGREFQEWELLEYSAVLVPDNPEALTVLRSKGLDPDQLIKEQEEAEKVPTDDEPAKEEEATEDVAEVPQDKEEVAEPEEPVIEETPEVTSVEVNTDTDEVSLHFSNGEKKIFPGQKGIAQGIANYVKLVEKQQKVVIDLSMVLRESDKLFGTTLRDVKREIGEELRTVRDDLRVPIVIGQGGGK